MPPDEGKKIDANEKNNSPINQSEISILGPVFGCKNIKSETSRERLIEAPFKEDEKSHMECNEIKAIDIIPKFF